jgi:hypothetical protein
MLAVSELDDGVLTASRLSVSWDIFLPGPITSIRCRNTQFGLDTLRMCCYFEHRSLDSTAIETYDLSDAHTVEGTTLVETQHAL